MKNKYEKEKARQQKRMRKVDASPLTLPHNRWEVFWDCLKNRWDIFLKIGGILFLSAIPLIALLTVNHICIMSLVNSLAEETITIEQYRGTAFLFNLIFIGAEALSLFIISVALAGVSRIIKRLVFFESIQFKEDFILGIKENVKQYSLTTIILVLIYFLSFLMLRLSQFAGNLSFLDKMLYYLPFAISAVIFMPLLLLVYEQIPIYKNTLKGHFKNAVFLYLKSPLLLPVTIVLLLPVYFLLIRNIYVILILGACTFLFILPIELIAFHVYTCSIFDKIINKDNYPQIYDKGIYRKETLKKDLVEINKINERIEKGDE